MKTTHDSALCAQLVRLALENRPMPKEEYAKRIGDSEYNIVAINSAVTYLINHHVLFAYKQLIGISQQHLVKIAGWQEIDSILQAAEGTNAIVQGSVQNPS